MVKIFYYNILDEATGRVVLFFGSSSSSYAESNLNVLVIFSPFGSINAILYHCIQSTMIHRDLFSQRRLQLKIVCKLDKGM